MTASANKQRKHRLGVCENCGTLIKAEDKYCCSGCYLASLLPVTKEGLPASWQLGVVCGGFFVLFNQMLFWLVAWHQVEHEEFHTAYNMGVASIVAGVAFLIFATFLLIIAKCRALMDLSIYLVALSLISLPIMKGRHLLSPNALEYFFVANVLLAVWLGRGLWSLWLARRRDARDARRDGADG